MVIALKKFAALKKNLLTRAALVFCAALLCRPAFAAAPNFTLPPSAEPVLSIQKLAYADAIAGLGQYTPRAGSNFTQGEACTIYVEAAGFSTPPVEGAEGQYSIDIAADLAVKMPNGRFITSQANMDAQALKLNSPLPMYFMGFAISLEGWTPGRYVLEVGVRDNISGQVVSQDLPLQVQAGQPAQPTQPAQ